MTRLLLAIVSGIAIGYGLALAGARPEPAPAPAAHAAPSPAQAVEIPEDEIIERFAEIWAGRQQLLLRNRFLGIQTAQNPLDVWITQEIIAEREPDFIVETGSYRGGSAALWATLLEQVNPEGRVLSVDIRDRVGAARKLPIVERRVEFLLGSSTDPGIVSRIAERVKGGRVLVILDSAHTRDHVLDELRAYSPLVEVGSYLIVQDTGVWRATVSDLTGAARAVELFLAENPAFEVDESRERFLLTNNPRGFLKRIR